MENAQSLKSLVLAKLPAETKLSDWHSAILDEACENAIGSNPNLSPAELVNPAFFEFAVSVLHGESLIQAGHRLGDQVTVNYRGQTFVFPVPLNP